MNNKNNFQTETVQINKGKTVFKEGDKVSKIALILKGKVDVFGFLEKVIDNKASKVKIKISTLAEGYMFGVHDIISRGEYLSNYVVASDCLLLLISIDNKSDLENYLNEERDYYTYSIATNSRSIKYINQINIRIKSILDEINKLNIFLTLSSVSIQERYKFEKPINAPIINRGKELLASIKSSGLILPENIDYSYFCFELLKYCKEENNMVDRLDKEAIKYFEELADINNKTCKDFFSESTYIAYSHLQKSSTLLMDMRKEMQTLSKIAIELFDGLNCDEEVNVYSQLVKKIAPFQDHGEIPKELLGIIESARYIFEETKQYFQQNLDIDITFGCNTFVELYNTLYTNQLKKNLIDKEKSKQANTLEITNALRSSAKKIVTYSQIEAEQGDLFLDSVDKYVKLKDKFAMDADSKAIRKTINSIFYHLYAKVFIKSRTQKEPIDRVIEMFLEFAYVDERLLEIGHLTYLYNLEIEKLNDPDNQIYSMTKWLDLIFENKRMPSINELDIDYVESLRELRKKRKYTQEEETIYLNDIVGKVEYEIKNMLTSTMKTCNGQILIFVPMLSADGFYGDMARSTNSSAKIQSLVQDIRNIDYSIFFREVLFFTQSGVIEREYVMREVRPDIIVVPTFGTKVIAWQEISSRNRMLPGRIVAPMFSGENLFDMLLSAFGQYRWDLCRSVMGLGWNNIQIKSLTSEYSDYLQFYKKNQLLSEIVKERVKQQITSNRNITKEIFAEDYLTWLKYEISGAVRLNKVVREIMIKYCTPSLEYRLRLVEQNIFRDYILKWNIKKDKKLRELENKYTKVKAEIKDELPKELEQNLIFYRDL